MLDNNTTELTEEAVLNIIDQLGLKQVNKWFDGNQSRIVYDCDKGDGTIVCVWVEPPYEAKVWIKNANPRNNGLVEDITTTEALADAISNIKPSDTGLLESVRPATDNEKYFLYKVDQLKNEKNAAKLEAVVKAFGLIRKVDTNLSDYDKEKFATFESLEKERGDRPKQVFIESITNAAMQRVDKEHFTAVRNALNDYRTWLSTKPKCD